MNRRHRRLPALALASSVFALLTGVVGWFWWDLLGNPLIGLAGVGRAEERGYAALCAALVGAAVGALLAPAPPAAEGEPPRPSPARITVVVLGAGVVAGGLAVAYGAPGDEGLSFGFSVFCAVPFAPLAALAVAALRRAGRARRGSIVARADARALLGTVAVVVGGCTALAVLDWPAAAAGSGVAAPGEALVLLLGAGVLVLGLLAADGMALRRVERLAASLDDALGAPGAGGGEPAPAAAGRGDLGLGDEIAAQAAPGTAYRGGGREIGCIRGDFEEAAAALRQSVRRGALMLALLEGVGLLHGSARATDLAADYGVWLCDGGREAACRPAALLVERAGGPAEEAARLHQAACAHGEEESCLATALLRRSHRDRLASR